MGESVYAHRVEGLDRGARLKQFRKQLPTPVRQSSAVRDSEEIDAGHVDPGQAGVFVFVLPGKGL